MSAHEIVAVLKVDGFDQTVVFNLNDEPQARSFIDEIKSHFDGAYMPGENDAEGDKPYVSVDVFRMPLGWTDLQPEFEGW